MEGFQDQLALRTLDQDCFIVIWSLVGWNNWQFYIMVVGVLLLLCKCYCNQLNKFNLVKNVTKMSCVRACTVIRCSASCIEWCNVITRWGVHGSLHRVTCTWVYTITTWWGVQECALSLCGAGHAYSSAVYMEWDVYGMLVVITHRGMEPRMEDSARRSPT